MCAEVVVLPKFSRNTRRARRARPRKPAREMSATVDRRRRTAHRGSCGTSSDDRRGRSGCRAGRAPARSQSRLRTWVFHCSMRSAPCRSRRHSSFSASAAGRAIEVRVVLEQQRRRALASSVSRRKQRAARMRSISASGTRRLPTFLLSDSTNTGRAGSKPESAVQIAVSNAFCVGCGASGRSPSTEPRCAASTSRSSTCAPACAQRLQEPALARARGAADHVEVEASGQRLEVGDDLPAEGLVAALEARDVPAHLAQHVRRARPSARRRASSRPAAFQSRGLPANARLEVARDVARDERGADALRLEAPTAACRSCPRARAPRRRAPGS